MSAWSCDLARSRWSCAYRYARSSFRNVADAEARRANAVHVARIALGRPKVFAGRGQVAAYLQLAADIRALDGSAGVEHVVACVVLARAYRLGLEALP